MIGVHSDALDLGVLKAVRVLPPGGRSMATRRRKIQWGNLAGLGFTRPDHSNGSENVTSTGLIPPDSTSTGTVTSPKNSCHTVRSYLPGGTPERE